MYIENQDLTSNMEGEELLHRHKRDLSWGDVEDFYADKNNFAMYLVLPIIVIVYGGCAVIYCIARCRRYLRRKKKKSLPQQEFEDEPVEEPRTNVPVVNLRQDGGATNREGASSSSEVRVSVERDSETPLPWQVPGAGATAAMIHEKKALDNRGYERDFDEKSRPPPSYDETYKPPIRPMSKPPPYEEKGIKQRRGSVEEIITLEAPPVQQRDFNDRKRRRPGSRPSSRQSENSQLQKVDEYDAEREKARQLVRGDRPRREPLPEKLTRQRTPDIISHARTEPLKPQYRPTQNDPKAEATLMARQAAQLLRLDHMGRQAGKKQKRLVFVAE
jgi:hypothetical protein